MPDERAGVPVEALVPGTDGSLGCLVIHGLTGTPHEMALVASALAGRYPLWLTRVAGHDTEFQDLNATSWRDWYDSAARGAEALLANVPRIVIVGLSMGALLAMRFAVDMPGKVAGIALLSPAVALGHRFPRWLRRPFDVLGGLDDRFATVRAVVSRAIITKGVSDIADEAIRADHPGYRRVPLRAVLNLIALQRIAADDAPRVVQPALVMHAANDHTCPIDDARGLYARLGSAEKRLVVLEKSFHVVTVDCERERVLAEVTAFVDGLARQPAS